jgi:hypothetical protein
MEPPNDLAGLYDDVQIDTPNFLAGLYDDIQIDQPNPLGGLYEMSSIQAGQASQASQAGQASQASGAPQAPQAPQIPQAAESIQASQASQGSEASQVPKVPSPFDEQSSESKYGNDAYNKYLETATDNSYSQYLQSGKFYDDINSYQNATSAQQEPSGVDPYFYWYLGDQGRSAQQDYLAEE